MQTMGKKLAIGLLFALSFTISPTAHAAIRTTEALTKQAMNTYNSMQKRYMMAPIAKEESLKRLVNNLTKLDFEQTKNLVLATLRLASTSNSEKVIDHYLNRFDPVAREIMRKKRVKIIPLHEQLRLSNEIREYYNQELGIVDFFRYLALIPSAQKDEVNELLQTYGVDPLPSK